MQQNKSINKELFKFLANQKPYARVDINGGESFPDIKGMVDFYALQNGVIVVADIENLPHTATNIFAFHIHEGTTCDNNFEDTGSHYNPTNMPHPNHEGDMPPLFSNRGRAWLAFYDARFNLKDIIGKTVIIHDGPDDFTTQPAGNSGTKIACGEIKKV